MEENIGCILIKERSPYNEMVDSMFADLLSHDWVYSVVEEQLPSNPVYRLLQKQKLQTLGGRLLNPILVHAYELEKALSLHAAQYSKLVVLFLNSSVVHLHYPIEILRLMKQKYKNTHWVLYYIDMINSPQSIYANRLRAAGIFDVSYTFDNLDAQKHGLRYWNTIYSQRKECLEIIPSIDLYFCGAEKGRLQQIVSIANQCQNIKIRYKMDVVFNQKCDKDICQYDDVTVHENGAFLRYQEVLQKTLQARCILEIVQAGQRSPTLRPFEAVCYHRKLLTNNPEIFNFSYYDPRYIQYFDQPDKINWDWIRQNNDVDFNYQNDFSPNAFFEDIRKTLLGGGAQILGGE